MSNQGRPSPAAETADHHITRVTRRRLLEGLTWRNTSWHGVLEEPDFLARIYDLNTLESTDRRHPTAYGDIFQHRVMNDDWDYYWIFTDERFGLAGSDRLLLRFLAETLHPDVRHDLAEVHELLAFFNEHLAADGYELVQVDAISGAPIFGWQRIGQGVRGTMKNLIFAAVGSKPEIVLADAVNNDLRIVRHEENCLVYDRPLSTDGLTWRDLTSWWAAREGITDAPTVQTELGLYRRLQQSLDGNGAELRVLSTYAKRYARLGPGIPALIPQVYLHYDPYTRSRHPAPARVLQRQRMDFLLLLPHRVRVVIECDGKQHYADESGRANSSRYAAVMAEDRELRLNGYEVYRFGGAELIEDPGTTRRLSAFFDRLATRYT
ncbi:hypothetical protein [Dactylosporangium sp. CA-139066]|uniref:AbiJ-related protein n=1 Tax=Dactylosporangium sp. CA-139066 TaxID=3239930 RepID=UPI003D8D3734